MQLADSLFPDPEFSTTELNVLAMYMNQPVVKKYLRHLAIMAIKDLTHGLRKEGESAESYLERRAVVSGGLEAVEQLLYIQPPLVIDGTPS